VRDSKIDRESCYQMTYKRRITPPIALHFIKNDMTLEKTLVTIISYFVTIRKLGNIKQICMQSTNRSVCNSTMGDFNF